MKQSLRAAAALSAFARRSAHRGAPPVPGLLESLYRLGHAIARPHGPRARTARQEPPGDPVRVVHRRPT